MVRSDFFFYMHYIDRTWKTASWAEHRKSRRRQRWKLKTISAPVGDDALPGTQKVFRTSNVVQRLWVVNMRYCQPLAHNAQKRNEKTNKAFVGALLMDTCGCEMTRGRFLRSQNAITCRQAEKCICARARLEYISTGDYARTHTYRSVIDMMQRNSQSLKPMKNTGILTIVPMQNGKRGIP